MYIEERCDFCRGDLRDSGSIPSGACSIPPAKVDCLGAALSGLQAGSLRGRRIGVVVPSQMGVSSPAAAIASKEAVAALRAVRKPAFLAPFS